MARRCRFAQSAIGDDGTIGEGCRINRGKSSLSVDPQSEVSDYEKRGSQSRGESNRMNNGAGGRSIIAISFSPTLVVVLLAAVTHDIPAISAAATGSGRPGQPRRRANPQKIFYQVYSRVERARNSCGIRGYRRSIFLDKIQDRQFQLPVIDNVV